MNIIKILLFGRGKRKYPLSAKKKSVHETPIRSVRRKPWLGGIQYEVKIQQAVRNSIKLKEQTLDVSLSRMTRENFETLLDGWYRRRAKANFRHALNKWLPCFEDRGYSVPVPRLKLFRMRRAWGRCYYTKKLITINLHLVKAPVECFEYIVLHELCHFVVQSHSKAFYALLSDILPDWKDLDLQLKSFASETRILSQDY